MGARTIFLTHFSQRYQKIAAIDQNAGTNKHDEMSFCDLAPKETTDPDIPLDETEEQPASFQSAAHLLDDIHFPLPNRPGLPRSDYIPGINAPLAAAMDYMRVKVGDLALAQAYAPAVEKLVELLERDANHQSEIVKKAIREAEEARKAKKNRKFASKKGVAAVGAAAAAAVATEVEEEPKKKPEPELPEHSVWSASESEAGWETSDYEE
jgi:ribonuclease Z